MAYSSTFSLRWAAGATTKTFRMQVADADHGGYLGLTSFGRNLDANLTEVAAPDRRMAAGMITILAADTATLADLLAARNATDLEAQMYGDVAYWNARWVSEWKIIDFDPFGNNVMVPMRLEQRS